MNYEEKFRKAIELIIEKRTLHHEVEELGQEYFLVSRDGMGYKYRHNDDDDDFLPEIEIKDFATKEVETLDIETEYLEDELDELLQHIG